ncbi:hypothetical protein MED222_06325 [Vibrio sp. MED222]|nr:hypothetical protein MED222_06325 [Vibrio sp. MED222]
MQAKFNKYWWKPVTKSKKGSY